MRRFDHPAQPVDPYPEPGTRIAAFRYDSALVLLRLKDAVKMRSGEDADYLTGGPFLVSWQPEGEDWRQIVVPAGLVTDLTSVPRLLRIVIGRVGPWLEAAIVHDYLYIAWQDLPDGAPRFADRAFADEIMRVAMIEAGVPRWAVWLIHKAVRWFGAGAYARRDEDRYVDLDDPDIRAQLPFRVPRLS